MQDENKTTTSTPRPASHTGYAPRPRTHTHSNNPRQGGGKSMSRRSPAMRRDHPMPVKKQEDVIPPIGDAIRIIPLGGVEEVGKNMTAIEYKDDIIVLDMGFGFSEDDTPGIDYLLPNTKYLEDNKHKIRAVIITHGHLDHTGGIPYIMPRIGNPPLYTRYLTSLMIKKRQEEFAHLAPLDIHIVEKEDHLRIGNFPVRFFSVTHTIPDSMGIIIETPYGSIVNAGDPKLDHNEGIPTDAEVKEYSKFAKENVLLFMNDSTNIDNPGWSTPEKLVHKNLEEIIKNINGRLIIGTFASQLERLIKVIMIAEKYGKKVVIEGRSMKTNIEIAKIAKMFEVKKDTMIPVEDVDKYPPDRVLILTTGAQGEDFSGLMRMANKTHKNFKINKRDTVLLSSSIIPGNEKTVQRLKDNIARQGARIIHYRTSDVYIHSTGHGNREELAWMFKKINPKFFMPIHGNHYMLRLHAQMIESLGMKEENIIVPDNGTIIEIQENGTKLVRLKESAPSSPMMVDGFSIGDIQEVVIRDRKMLAEDGMFVIIASVNLKTGTLRKSPDIISRGFIYLRESQGLLQDARMIIKRTVEETTAGMNPINFDYVKANITDAVSRFLFQKTAKKPIVIPVVLGV
jgi:ribonuclease J